MKVKKQGKKLYNANTSQKKRTGMTILISDKVYYRTRKITQDKEGHNITIKESLYQEDKTILRVLHQITLKCTTQKLMEIEETDKLKIMLRL